MIWRLGGVCRALCAQLAARRRGEIGTVEGLRFYVARDARRRQRAIGCAARCRRRCNDCARMLSADKQLRWEAATEAVMHSERLLIDRLAEQRGEAFAMRRCVGSRDDKLVNCKFRARSPNDRRCRLSSLTIAGAIVCARILQFCRIKVASGEIGGTKNERPPSVGLIKFQKRARAFCRRRN